MAWWWWVLLWLGLLTGSAAVFFLLGRSLWRKTAVLLDEVGTAAERLSAVSEGLQRLAESTAEPAVFTPSSQLRQERFLASRRHDREHPANPLVAQRKRAPQKPQQSVR